MRGPINHGLYKILAFIWKIPLPSHQKQTKGNAVIEHTCFLSSDAQEQFFILLLSPSMLFWTEQRHCRASSLTVSLKKARQFAPRSKQTFLSV